MLIPWRVAFNFVGGILYLVGQIKLRLLFHGLSKLLQKLPVEYFCSYDDMVQWKMAGYFERHLPLKGSYLNHGYGRNGIHRM